MKKQNNTPKGFMSAGEIAERAGVTIRTIQYYDQTGLLSPAAKGSRNQRFYSEKDLERLYRILCYKYMGLRLDDIRKHLDADSDQQFSETLHQQIIEAETVISEQMKRYAVLKDLENIDKKIRDTSWADFADIIDYVSKKWEMIMEISMAMENKVPVPQLPEVYSEETRRYYQLITDAARLREQGIPPQDKQAVDLIKEYMSIRDMSIASGTWDTKKEMIEIRPDNIRMSFNDVADFWSELKKYMLEASEQYIKEQEKQGNKTSNN